MIRVFACLLRGVELGLSPCVFVQVFRGLRFSGFPA